MRWDPVQHARHADHRSRPFFDLVAQIGARAPAVVLDVGCGSGELTATLARRWPGARVTGVDSSPEMIERAPTGLGVDLSVGDARDVDASGVDVLVTNAALQWVPGHTDLLARWAGQINAGGWIAVQVPDNLDAPSHALVRRLAGSPRWRHQLGGVLRDALVVARPETYLELFAERGLRADVWQTRYLHVLPGVDPVLEWVRGTGLRPVLQVLNQQEADAFTTEYAALLREAYPVRAHGTVFPFLRTFAVAHEPTGTAAPRVDEGRLP